MSFDLSNIPISFQGYINKIIAEKLDIFDVIYLDDILIYTKEPSQPHIEAVQWVLKKFLKDGFYANLKKCQFHKDKIRFLDFVILAQGIKMKEKKIEVVRHRPKPQSVKDIQMFLGFTNFYRRFIQNFYRIIAPLTLILRTTNDEALSTQATKNKKNWDVPASASGR